LSERKKHLISWVYPLLSQSSRPENALQTNAAKGTAGSFCGSIVAQHLSIILKQANFRQLAKVLNKPSGPERITNDLVMLTDNSESGRTQRGMKGAVETKFQREVWTAALLTEESSIKNVSTKKPHH